jgi:predicted N-acetyltransferase YhbS
LHAGIPFVAVQHGHIVGTVTLYAHSVDDKSAWYRQPGVYKFGQFGVEPALQGQGLGLRMYAAIEAEARARGAQHLALDTAEGAHHLIAWYAGLGYQFVDTVQWEHTNYRSVVLSKSLSA